MEFITPESLPTTIIATAILVTTVAWRIISDSKDTVKSNQLHRTLIALGKKHTRKSFSVIIELDKKADTLIPLLDHLYAQNYPKLEVIVSVKHTASKNARPTLLRYKRSHQSLNMQIIKHVAKNSLIDIARRKAKNALVMTMTPDERLSDDFFANVSLDFVSSKQKVVTLKSYVRLNNNLSTALRSFIGIHRNSKRQTRIDAATIQPSVIYRRTIFTTKSQAEYYESTKSIQAYTTSPKLTSPKFARQPVVVKTKIISMLIILATLSVISYVTVTMRSEDQILLVTLLALACVITYAIDLINIKAYSILDKISLILLAPIFVTQQLIVLIVRVVKQMPRLPRQLQSRTR